MTHTPGPWKVLCGDVVLECNEKEVVAWVGNIDGQMINNAHLISAAPDMLEALEWLSNEFDCRDDEYGMVGFTHDEFRKVNAAIRKARKVG
jgi:hypothetical protein